MDLFQNFEAANLLEGPGLENGQHLIKLAANSEELEAAQKLRFEVFNEELGEGIPENAESGLDRDEFDARCDHLLVYRGGVLIGTYRLMPGSRVDHEAFYTRTEFSIDCLGIDFKEAVEMGRMCVHPEHRRKTTLMLLLWGLKNYMTLRKARYLFGCSSLPLMSADDAEATYRELCDNGIVRTIEGVAPHKKNSFLGDADKGTAQVPQLLKVYLDFGAKVIGRPAFDPVFGCYDLLTMLDVAQLGGRGLELISKFDERSTAKGSGIL